MGKVSHPYKHSTPVLSAMFCIRFHTARDMPMCFNIANCGDLEGKWNFPLRMHFSVLNNLSVNNFIIKNIVCPHHCFVRSWSTLEKTHVDMNEESTSKVSVMLSD